MNLRKYHKSLNLPTLPTPTPRELARRKAVREASLPPVENLPMEWIYSHVADNWESLDVEYHKDIDGNIDWVSGPHDNPVLGTFDFEWSSYSPLDDIQFSIDIIVGGTNRFEEMELRVVPVKMERSRDLTWVKYVHNLQTSSVRVWRYAITVEVHNGLYL